MVDGVEYQGLVRSITDMRIIEMANDEGVQICVFVDGMWFTHDVGQEDDIAGFLAVVHRHRLKAEMGAAKEIAPGSAVGTA